MKVSSIRLVNFKRFTDLTIDNIPESAKLVVVVGPNGCGKSSLFDAFIQWYHIFAGLGYHADQAYHLKDKLQPFGFGTTGSAINLYGNEPVTKGCLYVRTAYRNDPEFNVQQLHKLPSPVEGIRIQKAIQNDQTVAQNYQRLIFDSINGLFSPLNDAKTVRELREELIGRLRTSMKNVFGDLTLNNISDPLSDGSFSFSKGGVKSYNYQNLSGGEKAAFDLLLDMHIKRAFFTNAIYGIDEVETHLHTAIQGKLLKEIVKIIPEQSQLWITTHSLGVLRAAQEMAADNPGDLCVIDFDGVDPDEARTLIPSDLGRVSWDKMMSIAVGDLSLRIAPKHVVVCEGSSVGNRRKDFDAEIYSRILGSRFPEVSFISGGSSNQVAATGVSFKDALSTILPTSKISSLMDRDDKSESEVAELELKGTFVLTERNLESILFADEVIGALVSSVGQVPKLADALRIKQDAITNSIARGNAADDLKSPAGEIYIGLKKLLGLTRCGNTTEAFMRDTLAPLVDPSMPTFQRLKAGVVDKLRNES